MTRTISLSKTLLDRAAVIQRMKSCGLSLDWLKAFSLPLLTACCGRMEAALPGVCVADKTLQRELIRNPAFAAYYARLLPLFPEDPPVEKAPEPAYGSRRYYSAPATPSPSPRAARMAALYGLLESCQANGRDVTAFPPDRLMEALALERLTDDARLAYLANFSSMGLSGEARQAAAAGLRRCVEVPLALAEPQKALLLEPFVADRDLFASAPFGEIRALLEDCPVLTDIVRLLHDRHVRENLTLDDYRAMAPDAAEHHRLLSALLPRLGAAAGLFLGHWRRNGCPLYELRTMERRTAEHPDADWSGRIVTMAGYVNQLYGARLRNIDLSAVDDCQEDVLVYAITHDKKHFIRLVDEHAELFLGLPGTSALFQEALYREHFNLNELTETDLAALARMDQRRLNVKFLAPGRRYTFPELRELCGQPSRYMQLYHLLRSGSQDYRLRVFRQVCKRGVLSPDMDDNGIADLAANLDSKPLDAWMQGDFGHIDGLTAGDAAQLLAHLDAVRHLLPGIRTRTDALLVLRNLDTLGQHASVAELKENLLRTDADWLALAEHMALTPEFLERHRESIIRFLCNNGAYIAETYRKGLGGKQRAAFLRVVKAELMGQLGDLKYFEGDLQRELDTPLTARVKAGWPANLGIAEHSLEVREHDGFFSTMLLGVQPQRTCMSYIDGQYRECLLSAFDSNKKILYATLNGRTVGRAFLRLTKGRLTGADVPEADNDNGFTFVDLERPDARPARPREREGLTLFLERPYISGAGPEVAQNVMRMFVELAERKADELDTMLVLSSDYRNHIPSGFTWTKYAVYISKSKAGAQYLDSLGGQATVSAEGSYKSNAFLVREYSGGNTAVA